ncbi:GNAT family N-acetyltransferase [Schwartzia succinivorans]|uniref:Protein N-acetyltransferase, RimJ/RimL family n=1 Tax=Schwartzia succinivorans DSM 10502 TaxID=1123243 RepID=A0A1M4ZIC7_9FIRM|nr:GNAT family protein [Schwartzia succinivorans]MBQ1469589.1 GNAT family N-acetyltransferase [Schwartzia sp. (in: firmicutes)]MBQ1917576.1 GNAT family N-acetyltransferase [Schwartzia sp. (in: firmicutes)]MBQ5414054.1 GNAT family N-acetyltransferase [Schwartzia sp. (in: firmicutes)]SHF17326.1 Protein N-acetyltransferase, RimJ/RimL family [Schwartzia succinivorans DSM 10502]
MGKIVKEGKRLRLRVAELKDLDYIMEAENRPENVRFILPESREVHEKGLNSESMVHFIVEEKDTGNAVGFLMIGNLNNPDHEVEWRKVIIDAKGRGYGHETMELLEEWSFEDMKFHRGWLDCKDYNERALHVYEAAGLQREALLRETMLVNGKYENLVILAILDREYFARKKSKGE